MTLGLIFISCLALFMLDAMLLRFAHLSLTEALTILGCGVAAMVVWVTAFNQFLDKNDR